MVRDTVNENTDCVGRVALSFQASFSHEPATLFSCCSKPPYSSFSSSSSFVAAAVVAGVADVESFDGGFDDVSALILLEM
jgi:hypothetical protein